MKQGESALEQREPALEQENKLSKYYQLLILQTETKHTLSLSGTHVPPVNGCSRVCHTKNVEGFESC